MGFQMYIWFDFMSLLIDHGKVLCSTVNELQQKLDAFSKECMDKLFFFNVLHCIIK